HGHERLHLEIHNAALSERMADLLDLPVAIGIGIDVLKGAAAADAKMLARRGDARGPRHDDVDELAAHALKFGAHAIARHRIGNVETFGGFAVPLVAECEYLDFALQVGRAHCGDNIMSPLRQTA